MSDEQECICGDPPYTDGKLCPVCLGLVASNLKDDVEAGKIDPMEAICRILILGRFSEDDEGQGDADE